MPDRDRALWGAVVAQAREDIETLPIGSTDYEAAAAFMTSTAAYWRRGRAEIAAHLEIHGDDLLHAGRRWVIARRRSEGLPDQPPAPARSVTVKVVPATKTPAEPLVIPDSLLAFLPARKRREAANNPFHQNYQKANAVA